MGARPLAGRRPREPSVEARRMRVASSTSMTHNGATRTTFETWAGLRIACWERAHEGAAKDAN
jgi:hypothetical protein